MNLAAILFVSSFDSELVISDCSLGSLAISTAEAIPYNWHSPSPLPLGLCRLIVFNMVV